MPIDSGVTLDESDPFPWLGGLIVELFAIAAAKAGETVTAYSSDKLGIAAVETEAADPPKTGPMVSDYNMDLLMQIFGELG